ncbi:MAG: Hsp20/alpha crystallin family protein [Planctomycetes bacterium]|nr:Hsp20/alpha crystallin family protein [Planctomycetota bacterium]
MKQEPPYDDSASTNLNPPLDRFRVEINRWLDAAKATGERAIESLGKFSGTRTSEPPIDIIELDERIVVFVDLPGVATDGVDLSITGNMLTVKATRRVGDLPEFQQGKLLLRERSSVPFERSIPLPVGVNSDAIQAELREGLLQISLGKIKASAGRSIPVVRGESTETTSTTSDAQ